MKKVEIPKFIADYIAEAIVQEGYQGVDVFDYVYDKHKASDWIDKEGNFTKLAQAIEFGYDIEKIPAVIQFVDDLKILMMKHGITRISSVEGKELSFMIDKDNIITENAKFFSNTDNDELERYLLNNGADFTSYRGHRG